jgi:hypothetical protein
MVPHKEIPLTYTFCRYIPKGPKKLIHFYLDKNNNYCAYLKNKDKHNNSKSQKLLLSFDNTLCVGKGTIISGTLIDFHNIKCFFIEDIILYKSNQYEFSNWKFKMQVIQNILKNINMDNVYPPNYILFGTPITRKTIDELNQISVPYKLYSVEYLFSNKKHYIKQFTHELETKVFFIRPDVKPDIYSLYLEKHVGYAYIPDFETSKMLNKIFRNIPENENLDCLEESDDEETFENIDDTKHVNLNEIKRFKCVYNNHFKQWKPIEMIS